MWVSYSNTKGDAKSKLSEFKFFLVFHDIKTRRQCPRPVTHTNSHPDTPGLHLWRVTWEKNRVCARDLVKNANKACMCSSDASVGESHGRSEECRHGEIERTHQRYDRRKKQTMFDTHLAESWPRNRTTLWLSREGTREDAGGRRGGCARPPLSVQTWSVTIEQGREKKKKKCRWDERKVNGAFVWNAHLLPEAGGRKPKPREVHGCPRKATRAPDRPSARRRSAQKERAEKVSRVKDRHAGQRMRSRKRQRRPEEKKGAPRSGRDATLAVLCAQSLDTESRHRGGRGHGSAKGGERRRALARAARESRRQKGKRINIFVSTNLARKRGARSNGDEKDTQRGRKEGRTNARLSVREKMSGPGRGGRRFEKCAREKQQSKQSRKKKQKKSRTEAGNSNGAPGSARRRIVGAALCVGLSQVCKDNIFEFFEIRGQGKVKRLRRRVFIVHRALLNVQTPC